MGLKAELGGQPPDRLVETGRSSTAGSAARRVWTTNDRPLVLDPHLIAVLGAPATTLGNRGRSASDRRGRGDRVQ